jgi:hypothetical protein
MIYKYILTTRIPISHKKVAALLFFIFFWQFTTANYLLHAQSAYQKIRINYSNNLLSISAKDADLKNVLLKLAKKSKFFIRFPTSLEKKITIKKNEISLSDALQTLLIGFNHVIIYSGPSKNQAAISEVFVFEKSRQLSGAERRIANRIRAYERQIESLKNNLLKIDENSGRGRRYLRRIRHIQKRIKRLEGQLN